MSVHGDEALRDLEEKLTRRMAESFESLGEIITEYANKTKSLTERMRVLEKGSKVNLHGANIKLTKQVGSSNH